MNKYKAYLDYVIRHKRYVYEEMLKVGMSRWQALSHDLSKFYPDEFLAYAEYFNGYRGKPWFTADITLPEVHYGSFYQYSLGILAKKERAEKEFNVAWLKHLHRNPHHWQHWVLRNDDGTTVALEMPERYRLEMIADWRGAGRAIHGKDETYDWYMANRDKMVLHPNTRRWVEIHLGVAWDDLWSYAEVTDDV